MCTRAKVSYRHPNHFRGEEKKCSKFRERKKEKMRHIMNLLEGENHMYMAGGTAKGL